MSKYLDMWTKIKESTEEERRHFLELHPRAEGKDLYFRGEIYFDVDLLEAVRNSLH